MGYIAHDAVIAVVHSTNTDTVEQLARFRKELDRITSMEFLSGAKPTELFIGPIMTVNHEYMYAFLPDGSKEGWGLSDRMQELREKFRRIAAGEPDEDEGYYENSVVAIRFGGDYGSEHGTYVAFTTDQPDND